jgi:hypothetical protein
MRCPGRDGKFGMAGLERRPNYPASCCPKTYIGFCSNVASATVRHDGSHTLLKRLRVRQAPGAACWRSPRPGCGRSGGRVRRRRQVLPRPLVKLGGRCREAAVIRQAGHRHDLGNGNQPLLVGSIEGREQHRLVVGVLDLDRVAPRLRARHAGSSSPKKMPVRSGGSGRA